MVIHKILNNNLILSRDGQGHEVIVKGCGIAFQKKKGQQVEESRIEKIFTAENAQISKEIQGYLTAIPEKYLDFVEAFVNDVKEKEGMKLNDSIYFSLSDHIMGAISRLENGIRLQNMLLLDIKQLYHKEYEIGLVHIAKLNGRICGAKRSHSVFEQPNCYQSSLCNLILIMIVAISGMVNTSF